MLEDLLAERPPLLLPELLRPADEPLRLLLPEERFALALPPERLLPDEEDPPLDDAPPREEEPLRLADDPPFDALLLAEPPRLDDELPF